MHVLLRVKTLQSAEARENGYHCSGGTRFAFLWPLFLLWLPLTASAVDLAEIGRLSRGGASQLALAMLSQHQPSYESHPREWLRWERVRLRIMQQRGQWSELAQRIADYPDGLPAEFRNWSEQRHASALINAGEYVVARQLLRGLIWSTAGEPLPAERLAQLRRLVMESYLEEGRIGDAYAAMLRYHQDYGEGDNEALLLRAKVLLAAGRAADSRVLLRRLQSVGDVDALMALATLRSGTDALGVLKQARNAVNAEQDDASLWLWLGVLAEVAQQNGDVATLIIALERMLPLELSLQGSSERRLFSFTPEDLWQGYLGYAERVGNREQLLRGDDQAWLSAAEQTDNLYPIRKRSLYAQVALHGVESLLREQAHRQLVSLFDAIGDEGGVLLQRLYLESDRYRDRRALPQVVAYRLVDEALKDADMETASVLLQQLPQPPGGTALFAWQMRRTRIFLLAGDYAAADRLLTTLMPHVAALNDEQRDQLIQLLFELQGVNEHERAFRLLFTMYQQSEAIDLRRELLFWMADSRKAQAMHADAARLYLQSATLSDNNSMDPWAQTARYQAAKSLTAAGLEADAMFIYRQLLKVTENPKRRSVLRHELQQLRLRGKAG